MITSIRLVNFKNFADETLRVGPFTILVGANASGKSNIRDAFRFLSGIGRGYTLAEIFGGKREAGWSPIRGAMNELVRFGQEAFSVEVEMSVESGLASARFMIDVGSDVRNPSLFRLITEKLEVIYQHGSQYNVYQPSRNPHIKDPAYLEIQPYVEDKEEHGLLRPFRARPDQPVLIQLGEHDRFGPDHKNHYLRKQVIDTFSSMRFLEFSPDRMREPAAPGATRLGDSGENLPVVLQEICADAKRREILISWIAELTPMDVTGFEFPIDPSGRIHLSLCEKNGIQVSASSASDGTLRFLATLAVLLGDNPNGLYFFDEIDTGIHPARLSLLMDLIERQTAKRGIQVVATTHAPTLLTVMNDDTFENSSVVCRLEDNTDAVIRPLANFPNVRELRKDQGLGRLHESGWMEDMLFFSEGNEEEADGE